MRMKHAMVSIVDEKRLTMFRQSTDEVRTRLARMVTALEELMQNKADEVHLMMRRDYTAVLGGPEIPKGGIMPKWQRDMRRDVRAIIKESGRLFKRVVGVEDESEEGGDGEEEGKWQSQDDDVKSELNLHDDDDEPLFRGGGVESDDGTVDEHAMNGDVKDIKMRDSPQPQAAQQRDPTNIAGVADTVKPETTDAHTNPAKATIPFKTEYYGNESFHPSAYDDDEDDDDEDNISVDSCGMPKGVYSDEEGDEAPVEWGPGYGTYDMEEGGDEDEDDWSSSGMSGLEEVDDDEEEEVGEGRGVEGGEEEKWKVEEGG